MKTNQLLCGALIGAIVTQALAEASKMKMTTPVPVALERRLSCRKPFPVVPPRVEYSATKLAWSNKPLFEQIETLGAVEHTVGRGSSQAIRKSQPTIGR